MWFGRALLFKNGGSDHLVKGVVFAFSWGYNVHGGGGNLLLLESGLEQMGHLGLLKSHRASSLIQQGLCLCVWIHSILRKKGYAGYIQSSDILVISSCWGLDKRVTSLHTQTHFKLDIRVIVHLEKTWTSYIVFIYRYLSNHYYQSVLAGGLLVICRISDEI